MQTGCSRRYQRGGRVSTDRPDQGPNGPLSGNNTFAGAFAGQTNFGGSYGPYNTFIGASSGFTVSSPPGEGNTLVGGLSSIGSQSLFNATAIGYNATVTQSNSLVLG